MKRRFTGILIALVVLLLGLAAWRAYLSRTINRELAEIRAAGLPVNGEELNRWYPAVPDDRNAALGLMRAFELRTNFSDSRSDLIFNFKLPPGGKPLAAREVDLLQAYVAMNGPMIARADEALKLPESRYPVDFTQLMSTPLPHLTWLKNLAEIYQYRAVMAIQLGQPSNANQEIERILKLSHTLDAEPCLISQLVRVRLIKIAFATLERRINAGTISADEIPALATAFEQISTTNICVRAFIGERALVIPYFRMTRAEAAALHVKSASDPKSESPLPYNGPFVLRWIGYYDLDYGSFLIGMRRAIALAGNEAPENLQAAAYQAHVAEESTKRHRVLSGILFSSFGGAIHQENEGMAMQRLALTALAIEGYRNKSAKLPETLAALVPDVLGKEPEDPFTGRPLNYLRADKGYRVYSVGPNLRDDHGGSSPEEEEPASGKKSDDISLNVER